MSSAKESAVENFEKTRGSVKRILVTGGGGQIGSELTLALREKHGAENVIATDLIHDREGDQTLYEGGPFAILDVTNRQGVLNALRDHRVDTVVHLAALLSARGEKDPELAWNINVTGTLNVLSSARDLHLGQVFIPSSIAVFGAGIPKDPAPNDALLIPSTIYGISKVAGELLGNYYVSRFGLDVRGLRYPGIISATVMPKGGTTDFAVEMFHGALKEGRYTCFVREDTRLPMMYMKDCIKATLDLMDAPFDRLVHHTDFNVSGMSFSAGELALAIRKYVPNFECRFEPDHRQAIADSWPCSLDDSKAREEWGWQPSFTLETMVQDMIDTLRRKFQKELEQPADPEPPRISTVRPSRPSFYPRHSAAPTVHR
jgi:nucleoside-diphosphate-sugar epimerase